MWLFFAVPWVCLQFMIVVFPDHTNLLFLASEIKLGSGDIMFPRASVFPSDRQSVLLSVTNSVQSCERNFYNFIRIFLKLNMYFCQGLKMCIRSGLVILRLFLSLFVQFELSHVWDRLLHCTKAYRRWVSCESNSSYNFIRIIFRITLD